MAPRPTPRVRAGGVDDYESTRQRHLAEVMQRLPEHLERLTWSAQQLRDFRTPRLRELLALARARSPWHRARLAGVDVAHFDEDDLRTLPMMTKADLMANFDAIVTDPRVTLAAADAHVAGADDRRLFPRRPARGRLRRLERRARRLRLGLGRLGRGVPEQPAPAVARREHDAGRRPARADDRRRRQRLALHQRQSADVPLRLPADAPVPGDPAAARHRRRPQPDQRHAPHLVRLDARHPRGRGARRTAAHRSAAGGEHRRAAAARDPRRGRGRLARADRQHVGNVGGRHHGARLLPIRRHAPERGHAHRRAGGRARRAGTGGRARRQGLPDRALQPGAAVDPLRAHRRGDDARRALPVRSRLPARRRHSGPPRRRLPLRGWRRRAPAHLPHRARPPPRASRVSGAADASGRRAVAVRGGSTCPPSRSRDRWPPNSRGSVFSAPP